MGSKPTRRNDEFRRLMSITGEEFALGGKVSNDCLELESLTVTPALREVSEYICTNEKALNELQSDDYDKVIVKKHDGFYFAFFNDPARGPFSPGGNGATRPQMGDSYLNLMYFDFRWKLWLSVYSWNTDFGRNLLGYIGYLYSAGIIPPNAAGVLTLGTYWPVQHALMAWSGSSTNVVPGDPTNTQVWLYNAGAPNYVVNWPTGSNYWSESMSSVYQLAFGNSLRVAIQGNGVFPPNAPDNPKVFLSFKRRINPALVNVWPE